MRNRKTLTAASKTLALNNVYVQHMILLCVRELLIGLTYFSWLQVGWRRNNQSTASIRSPCIAHSPARTKPSRSRPSFAVSPPNIRQSSQHCTTRQHQSSAQHHRSGHVYGHFSNLTIGFSFF